MLDQLEQFINQLRTSLTSGKGKHLYQLIESDIKEASEKKLKSKSFNFIYLNSYKHRLEDRIVIAPIYCFNEATPVKNRARRFYPLRRRNKRDKESPKKISFNRVNYEISHGFNTILENLDLLEEDGHLIISCEDGTLIKEIKEDGNIFEEFLDQKGYSVNAIIGIDQSRRYFDNFSFYIISKKNKEILFVAELSKDWSNSSKIINNLSAKNSPSTASNQKNNDLETGFFMKKTDFYSLRQERSKSKIQKITAYDQGYTSCNLGEILTSMEDATHYSVSDEVGVESNSLYIKSDDDISLREISDEEIWVDSIATLKPNLEKIKNETKSRYSYFKITLKDRVKAEYLVIFLRSFLGRELFRSTPKSRPTMRNRLGVPVYSSFTREDLKKLPVHYPDLKTQESIIEANDKIIKLQDSINEYKETLSSNPNKLIKESSDQIQDLLSAVGKLNDAERIRNHIRKIEGGYAEFKETWRFPVDTQGKKIKGVEFDKRKESMQGDIFRVINSFLNSYGGDLMIGIHDTSHEIRGIEKEIDHYWRYDEAEPFAGQGKFLDKFLNNLRGCFKDEFIGDEKNIFWRFVPIEGKTVFLVRCRQASKRCYIQEKGKKNLQIEHSFYQRIGDKSEPIDNAEARDKFWENRKQLQKQI